jgi:hypothetical protein
MNEAVGAHPVPDFTRQFSAEDDGNAEIFQSSNLPFSNSIHHHVYYVQKNTLKS